MCGKTLSGANTSQNPNQVVRLCVERKDEWKTDY